MVSSSKREAQQSRYHPPRLGVWHASRHFRVSARQLSRTVFCATRAN